MHDTKKEETPLFNRKVTTLLYEGRYTSDTERAKSSQTPDGSIGSAHLRLKGP